MTELNNLWLTETIRPQGRGPRQDHRRDPHRVRRRGHADQRPRRARWHFGRDDPQAPPGLKRVQLSPPLIRFGACTPLPPTLGGARFQMSQRCRTPALAARRTHALRAAEHAGAVHRSAAGPRAGRTPRQELLLRRPRPRCRLRRPGPSAPPLSGPGWPTGLEAQSQPGIETRYLRAIDAPLPQTLIDDAPFDLVICTEVLEHVADWPAAWANLSRLVAPGGVLIVTAPPCLSPARRAVRLLLRPTPHAFRHWAARVASK